MEKYDLANTLVSQDQNVDLVHPPNFAKWWGWSIAVAVGLAVAVSVAVGFIGCGDIIGIKRFTFVPYVVHMLFIWVLVIHLGPDKHYVSDTQPFCPCVII